MKRFLLRIENWLLIVPIILLLIEKICFPNAAFDLHIYDTYLVIAAFHFGIIILLFCWILYLCHFSLRARKSGNKKILNTHVIATLLLLSLFFLWDFLPPEWNISPMKPRRYYDYSSWQSFRQFDGTNIYIGILCLGFVLIQILFILYTIFRLIVKK